MKKSIVFVYLSAMLFLACEKVIEIDLNAADPQVVVEGFIDDGPGPYEIKLSYTSNFFDANNFLTVNGAIVSITDGTGFTEQLSEVSPGYYKTNTIQGLNERSYTLNILANGKEYTGTSVLPDHANLDSLTYEYKSGTNFTLGGFYVTLYFKEIAGKGHKYLFNIYKNGEVPSLSSRGGGGPFLIYEDVFFDGQDFDFEFYPYRFFPKDTIVVELITLNDDGYKFFKTLNATLNSNSGGGFSELPQNPATNMSEGAIGYFGAVAISRDTIIIK